MARQKLPPRSQQKDKKMFLLQPRLGPLQVVRDIISPFTPNSILLLPIMSTFAAPGTYLQELVLATATTDQKIACVSCCVA
jgi:hypothetical protein